MLRKKTLLILAVLSIDMHAKILSNHIGWNLPQN